ncbi:50S ribosomal protein L19e [Candidatus Woesearchaeota archaeon]|nr:50S ribosomal protein L19e [Candidatus Woesearchaeota archaeon]
MKLNVQKRIAASLLKAGQNRVVFDNTRLNDIKEAITKADIRRLINDGAIKAKQKKGISSFRTNKLRLQKRKGKRKGIGSRKGTKTARTPRKRAWITKVRVQRRFIKLLKIKKLVAPETYTKVYKMIKGNQFRSKRHLKLYLDENNLFVKKK